MPDVRFAPVTLGAVGSKTPRMDVRIVVEGPGGNAERAFDIEAQCYPEDVDNRSLFYGAQLICENTVEGTAYKDIPQAVVITLLDAPPAFPEAEGFVHVCGLRWNVGIGADWLDWPEGAGLSVDGSDRLVFALVELSKVRARYNRLNEEVLADDLLSWAYLLTRGYNDESEVRRIMRRVPPIEDFAEAYGRAVDDPKVKRAYEDAVSAEREYQSRQDYFARLEREAVERGLERGLEQGRKLGMSGLADELRKMGVADDVLERAIAAAAGRA